MTHVIEPFNCTLFYMQHQVFLLRSQLNVCPPERVVRNYEQVADVTGLKQVGRKRSIVQSMLACRTVPRARTTSYVPDTALYWPTRIVFFPAFGRETLKIGTRA